MPSCPSAVTGGLSAAQVPPARRRAACVALAAFAALAAALAAPAFAATPPPSLAADDAVWITVGTDVFAAAQRAFAPRPGFAGFALERLDAHDSVVLTRIPADSIDALSQLVHEQFHACGGFVLHENEARARAAMARRRTPRPEPLVLPFTIDQPTWVNHLAGQVSENQLLSTMTALSNPLQFPNRYHGHHNVWHSADWIRFLWLSYVGSRPDVTVELFSHGGLTPQPSVILTIPGTTLPDEIVVVGGHQDSIVSGCSSNPNCVAPGADDDASGIAVLSEVIRVALASGFQGQRTVQFMAYAAEEIGLVGSDDIAQTYFNQGADVVAVLQQDMTAYEGSPLDIYVYTSNTDTELNSFVVDLIETYQPGLTWGYSSCGYACSDHASWDDRGYRASFAFEAAFGDHSPYIHTANDTVANLLNGPAHAAKFARLAAAFMVEAALDGAVPDPMPFLDGFETADTSRWTLTVP